MEEAKEMKAARAKAQEPEPEVGWVKKAFRQALGGTWKGFLTRTAISIFLYVAM
jgi:hypothetical protein